MYLKEAFCFYFVLVMLFMFLFFVKCFESGQYFFKSGLISMHLA